MGEKIDTTLTAGDTRLLRKWKLWHSENPEFYEMFCRFAREAISSGHQRLSAWLIVNRIRWETSIVTRGDDYKISNDFIALYSRLFMTEFPQYEGFFLTKYMKRLDPAYDERWRED